jgi:taurine dioxygenase
MSTALTKPKSDRKVEIVPMKAALGAEVRGVDLAALDDATFDELHGHFLDHLLLVIRDQKIEPQDLVNFAKRFGTPVSSSNLHKRALEERTANKVFNLPPEVTVVTNVKQDGKAVGILGDGEVVWHADFSFKDRPTAARMLLAVEIPPSELGGHTYFTNCYAAYDTLSEDVKRRIAGMTIKQANIVDTAMQLRPGASLDADIRDIEGPSHPIVSSHPETGASMLFLGRRHSAYVNGLTLQESAALLDELWAHATQPHLVYEHEWSVGDVVVWDNRATLHKRDSFESTARRVLYAAQVEGHKPFEAPDAMSRPPHPRFHDSQR